MAEHSGREAYLSLDNAAGSLTDLRDYVDSAALEREADSIDVTTLGDKDTERIPGFIGGTIPISGKVDFAAGASHSILGTAVGAEGSAQKRTYNYGPSGNTAGEVKYSGESVILSYSISISPDDAISFEASIRADGAIARGTF